MGWSAQDNVKMSAAFNQFQHLSNFNRMRISSYKYLHKWNDDILYILYICKFKQCSSSSFTWILALSWLFISSDESWRTFLFICLHKVEFDYISPESCYPPDKFDWNATKLKGKVLKYAGHWPIRMQKKQDLLWFFTFQPFQDEIEVYRKRRP